MILVDNEGTVTYLERAMVDPIDPFNPNWDVNKHEFVVERLQAKYGTRQTVNESVSGKTPAKTSEIKENASSKRLLEKSTSEDEPPAKKKVNDTCKRSLKDGVTIQSEYGGVEEEQEKLDKEESNCTSASKKVKTCIGDDDQHASLRPSVRPGVVANGRVVTNGTV